MLPGDVASALREPFAGRRRAGRAGPYDGILPLHGRVPVADNARRGFDERVIHEELPADGDV